MTRPLTAARAAAKAAFAAHLDATRSTATIRIPDAVIAAAEEAYRKADGRRSVVVVGYGNATHPVCGVDVKTK